MTHVLMVCIGNVCRSPLAERLLVTRAAAAGLHVTSESAGVGAMVGSGMEPNAAAELTRLGGDPDGFVARLLTADQAAGADLILTATKEIRARVLQEAPAAMRRTFTLREFAALCDVTADSEVAGPELVAAAARFRARVAAQPLDVTDPMGLDVGVHREVADEISDTVDRIIAGLSRAAG